MKGRQISFIIRATYDVLPTPKNLHQWLGEDPSCALCQTPATLRHILTGCKTSLSQGRYTWRHNQVLRQLAITLEGRRTTNNALPPQCLDTQRPPFCKSRTTPSKAICKSGSNPPRHCPGLENAG
ncbi:hypothetical protein AAFF_G00209720 [Aldrovandia affinis]|uniref:Reverse transcriptase zinc-binding domain-containing protein n=1 Tax=Aldrovandia affinis TaxID=143900 RepID=A0AAD7WUG4_9TELE|nr:hypothetical protein AAFF_G00209720 [Aldrovandia affinis]